MSIAGHLWTLGALARRTLFPPQPPASEPWQTRTEDPETGEVWIRGRLSRLTGSRKIVVLIHGLGGSSESQYMASSARAAHDLELASLRLNLRGADGLGGDFYHGGLTSDLHTVVDRLGDQGFEKIFVLGFSLGGHLALRFATEVGAGEVTAIAAVCSPLDLAAGADAMDRPHMAVYRRYILRKLLENYRRTAQRGRPPTSPDALRSVRTLRHWDSLTVVPRFGFVNPDDYYQRASVGPRLGELRRPALLVAAEHDPMIPPSTIRPALEAARNAEAVEKLLTVLWRSSGGHLGFPKRLDLGLEGPLGIESQVLLWLERAGLRPGQSPSRTSRTQQ